MSRPQRESQRKRAGSENAASIKRTRPRKVSQSGASKSKYPKRTPRDDPVASSSAGIRLLTLSDSVLSDVAKVKNTLRIFNMYYLQASKDKQSRPDLVAAAKMRDLNAVLFPKAQIGSLPGINVGDQFLSRAEMMVLGLHKHWMNGIDFIGQSKKPDEYVLPPEIQFSDLPIATCIVISGGYEDDVDNLDDVTYTGQGGNNITGDKRQTKNQEMTRGNLALKNCIKWQTVVRVIRGHESKHNNKHKIYSYDGLYKVVDYWAAKGNSGFTVFKYRLIRCEGQPMLITELVHFCNRKVPKSSTELTGLVCEDISKKLEHLPVPASNTVDHPPVAPAGYRYTNKVEIAVGIAIPPPAKGCDCVGTCSDVRKCSCARLNGNTFPYVNLNGGRLAVPLDVVYECGPNCGCGPNCLNRTSQRGLQHKLEVFKTPNKGWAVRSWDPILAGAPVCEYYGKLLKSEGLEVENDVYIFDLDCIQTMRGIDGRQRRWGDTRPFLDDQNGVTRRVASGGTEAAGHAEFCLDGSECGSVARFINHSCDPNLFIQCVLSSHHDLRMPRIVLFAADNIAPLQELTYDYGYQIGNVGDGKGHVKQMPCYCGAISCRKRLY